MATNNGTPAVDAALTCACRRSLTLLVAAVPALDRPVSITLPTWSLLIAVSVAVLASDAGVPTMNSCPTRWASDIPASTSLGLPEAAGKVAARAGVTPTATAVSAAANEQAIQTGPLRHGFARRRRAG